MQLFSQNHPAWKKTKLGISPYTVGQYGCTTTCISDASSYFGEDTLPLTLARNLTYISQGYVVWSSIGKFFKKLMFFWRFYKHDEKLIAEALKHPDKVVLLNVDRNYHWVFLLGKVPLLGYRCSDPYPYPARVRYYKSSEVGGGAILIRK